MADKKKRKVGFVPVITEENEKTPPKSCLKKPKPLSELNGDVGAHRSHALSSTRFGPSTDLTAGNDVDASVDEANPAPDSPASIRSESERSPIGFRVGRLKGTPETQRKVATFHFHSTDESESEHTPVHSDADAEDSDEESRHPKEEVTSGEETDDDVLGELQPRAFGHGRFPLPSGARRSRGHQDPEDEETDDTDESYSQRFRNLNRKRVSFDVGLPSSSVSEWKPGMVRSISEITEGLSMDEVQGRGAASDDPAKRTRKISGTRESSQHLSELSLQLAAQYVKNATDSRHTFFNEDAKSLLRYQWYNMRVFVVILYLCVFGDLCLVLFEEPAVPALRVPFWATMIFETFFMMYFLGRAIHNFTFDRRKEYWKKRRNIVLVASIALTLLDMVTYVLIKGFAPVRISKYAIRWSRPIRPVFLASFPSGEKLRGAFINVIRSIPEIFAVLVMFICSIAIFALVWFQLLRHKGLVTSSGAPYFVDYFDSFWDLYVLVTTANNPDVMLPAFDYSNWFAILWFIYMCVNLYIFMNIVLAVVYNGYKMRLKQNVRMKVYLRRRQLKKAFDLIKMKMNDGYYAFRSDRWHSLMKLVDKKYTPNKTDILFTVLDDNGDGAIDAREFLLLTELVNYDLAEVMQRKSYLETHFKYYDSKPSMFVRRIVMHNFFEYFIDILIIANSVCIALDLRVVEWFFLPFFAVEICLRIYTISPRKYFGEMGLNAFDFFLIFTPLCILMLPKEYIFFSNKGELIDFLLVLRILRIVRSARAIKQLNLILMTIGKIFPFIFTYGGVLFAFYYFYSIIGMEIFKERITFHGYTNLTSEQMYCGNIHLNGSEFWIKKYCGCNFNDAVHAWVVLFTQMVVNQWHEITNGFVLVTNKGARVYFIMFHMTCVVILMNIFSALIIEAFFLAYQVERTDIETNLQRKIKAMGLLAPNKDPDNSDSESDDSFPNDDLMSATGYLPSRRKSVCDSIPTDGMLIQRRLARNSRLTNMRFKIEDKSNMRVETLIQRLFAGELDDNYEDSEEEEFDKVEEPTLDSVMDTYPDIARYTTN